MKYLCLFLFSLLSYSCSHKPADNTDHEDQVLDKQIEEDNLKSISLMKKYGTSDDWQKKKQFSADFDTIATDYLAYTGVIKDIYKSNDKLYALIFDSGIARHVFLAKLEITHTQFETIKSSLSTSSTRKGTFISKDNNFEKNSPILGINDDGDIKEMINDASVLIQSNGILADFVLKRKVN